MTNKHLLIMKYLAVYKYISIENVRKLLSNDMYYKEITNELLKMQYIEKYTFNLNPAAGEYEFLGYHRRIKKLLVVKKWLEKKKQYSEDKKEYSTVIEALKKYSGEDWRLASCYECNIFNIYKLTSLGIDYMNVNGYRIKNQRTGDQRKIKRDLVLSNLACILKDSSQEIEGIPTVHDYNKEYRCVLIPSQNITENSKNVTTHSKVLCLLYNVESGCAVYYLNDASTNFSFVTEANIFKTKLFDKAPIVDNLTIFIDDLIDFKLIEKRFYRSARGYEGDIKNIHIIPYNEEGLRLFCESNYRMWFQEIVLKTLPSEEVSFNTIDEMHVHDAVWKRKYVFVMITNEVYRNIALGRLALSKDKCNVIIICLESQFKHYNDKRKYPGAEVISTSLVSE